MSTRTESLKLRDFPALVMPGRCPRANQAITQRRGLRPGARLSLPQILEHALLRRSGRAIWISREPGAIHGLAALRRRTGRAAWEIETLTINGQSDAALLDLLDRVVASAGADGTLRLFLRLAAGSPLIEPTLRHGFARVCDETLYEAVLPPAKTAHDVAVRPREPSDDVALFQLFSSRTPQEVRWHLALAPSEWRAAQEPLPGRVREWVLPAEQDGALDALIRVGRADHGSALQLLTRGTSLASVVAFALAQAVPGRPVRALIPEFAPEEAHALEDAGLQPTGRTTLLVRPSAQRARRLESFEAALEGDARPAV